MTEQTVLVPPYKGELVDLIVPAAEQPELFAYASGLHSIQLTQRETCDLEMLATGAFSPLRGFMDKADHAGVVNEMRLADSTVFPIPITLPLLSLATKHDISSAITVGHTMCDVLDTRLTKNA